MIRYWPAKLWSAKKPQEAIKPTYNNNEQLAFGSKTPNRNVSLIVNHQFACVEAGKNTVVRNGPPGLSSSILLRETGELQMSLPIFERW